MTNTGPASMIRLSPLSVQQLADAIAGKPNATLDDVSEALALFASSGGGGDSVLAQQIARALTGKTNPTQAELSAALAQWASKASVQELLDLLAVQPNATIADVQAVWQSLSDQATQHAMLLSLLAGKPLGESASVADVQAGLPVLIQTIVGMALGKPLNGPLNVAASVTAGVQGDVAEVVAYHPDNKPVSLDFQSPGGQVTVNGAKVQTEADVIAKVADLLTKSPALGSPLLTNPRVGGTVFTIDGTRVLSLEHVDERTWLRISNGVSGPEIGVKSGTGSTIDGNIRLRPLGRGAVEVGTATSTATVRAAGDLTPDIDLDLEAQGNGEVKVGGKRVLTTEDALAAGNVDAAAIQALVDAAVAALPDSPEFAAQVQALLADLMTQAGCDAACVQGLVSAALTPTALYQAVGDLFNVLFLGMEQTVIDDRITLVTNGILANGVEPWIQEIADAIADMVDADTPAVVAAMTKLRADVKALQDAASGDVGCMTTAEVDSVLAAAVQVDSLISTGITDLTNGYAATLLRLQAAEAKNAAQDAEIATLKADVANLVKAIQAINSALPIGGVQAEITRLDTEVKAKADKTALDKYATTNALNSAIDTLASGKANQSDYQALLNALVGTAQLPGNVGKVGTWAEQTRQGLAEQASLGPMLEAVLAKKADNTRVDAVDQTVEQLVQNQDTLLQNDADIVEYILNECASKADLAQFGQDVEFAIGNMMAEATRLDSLFRRFGVGDSAAECVDDFLDTLNDIVGKLLDATGVVPRDGRMQPVAAGDTRIAALEETVGRLAARADDEKTHLEADVLNMLTGGKEVPANIDWTPCKTVAGTGDIEVRLINGVAQFRGELTYTQTASGSYNTVRRLPDGFPRPAIDTNLTAWAIESQVTYRVGAIRLSTNGDIGVSAPTGKFTGISFNGISYPVF